MASLFALMSRRLSDDLMSVTRVKCKASRAFFTIPFHLTLRNNFFNNAYFQNQRNKVFLCSLLRAAQHRNFTILLFLQNLSHVFHLILSTNYDAQSLRVKFGIKSPNLYPYGILLCVRYQCFLPASLFTTGYDISDERSRLGFFQTIMSFRAALIEWGDSNSAVCNRIKYYVIAYCWCNEPTMHAIFLKA